MRRSAPVRFGSVRVRTPLVVPGLRVGVMGGSFNPPHSGHVLISHTALRRLDLDQLWWVVTPGNPLKETGDLPPQEDRIAACRAMTTDARIKVTGFEADLGTPYTAATLAFLVRRHRGVRFVWIMGADNLAGFHRWQHWREIMRTMPVAVVDRPGWRHRAMASKAALAYRRAYVPERRAADLPELSPPAWTLLTGPLSPLSSTALRAARRTDAPRQPRS
ncbi:MAG: nicotinate-nucleotide adenylyltransferase [Hyphomicrobiaceae bacterium]|nr:nicotinate-nucleotide adenylyltransferase [Hyphomicrobiaceae bacterium]